ncbi:hypothetical protein, partial [Burkholderia pseudomallei]|uniref:hypothetical protein n=1 Tax=Burkholderia pseudomallei TaxID=28450 RepID=UPI0015E0DA7F
MNAIIEKFGNVRNPKCATEGTGSAQAAGAAAAADVTSFSSERVARSRSGGEQPAGDDRIGETRKAKKPAKRGKAGNVRP